MICYIFNMITVPEVVEELVKRRPFLEEGLSLGVINLSSLARYFQPEIQKKLYKDIKVGAIVMALKRLEKKLQVGSPISPIPQIFLTDLSVRSNLVEFTFQNSPTLMEKQEKILQLASKEKSSFLTFTHGVFETTLIISANLEKEVGEIFEGEALVSKFTHLSAITLILPKETVYQPGSYYQILKKLAWEGINFIEIISSQTELTIILEEKWVDKAFSVIKNPL